MLRITSFSIAILASAFILPFSAGSASAEAEYPWCAVYTGPARGVGVATCGFTNKQQCEMTVKGLGGGYCEMNARYNETRQLRRP